MYYDYIDPIHRKEVNASSSIVPDHHRFGGIEVLIHGQLCLPHKSVLEVKVIAIYVQSYSLFDASVACIL